MLIRGGEENEWEEKRGGEMDKWGMGWSGESKRSIRKNGEGREKTPLVLFYTP